MGDHSCDACVHTKVRCMWPTTGSLQQVYFGCQRMHRKCEIGRKLVTAQGPRKKCKVVSRATIEGDEDNAEWVLPPPAPKAARMAELPFTRTLAGVVREMKASRKSLEQIAQDALEVSCEMLSQMMALVDLVELQGKHFVRMRKMGRLESDGEELLTRWSKKSKGKAKEDELEEEPEEEEEAEEKDELEGEPEDVNMTLS